MKAVQKGAMTMRRGLTLVELLVVIAIMAALLAYVLPKVSLDSRERRVTEASRLVVSSLGQARSTAIETGRSAGVTFVRDPNALGAAQIIRFVENPAPYAGDDPGAKISLQALPTVNGFARFRSIVPNTLITPGLIGAGDKIQFNNQGHQYRLTLVEEIPPATPGGTPSGLTAIEMESVEPVAAYVPNYSYPVSFSIARQPTATFDPPISLPRDTCVDLTASGFGNTLFDKAGANVTVMFSPQGHVDRIFYSDASGRQETTLSSPLFFLVGTLDNVPQADPAEHDRVAPRVAPNTEDEKRPNWQILGNRWVRVTAATGAVRREENAASPNWDSRLVAGEDPYIIDGIRETRTFAAQ